MNNRGGDSGLYHTSARCEGKIGRVYSGGEAGREDLSVVYLVCLVGTVGCYLRYLYVPGASRAGYNRACPLDGRDYTSLSWLSHRK